MTRPTLDTDSHDGLHRRTVLHMPVALAAACGLTRIARRPGAVDEFEALAERWKALHAEVDVARIETEEAYLNELAAALVKVPTEKLPGRLRTVYDEGGLSTGPAWMGGSIFLVEAKLDPDAFLGPHNHPGFCVLTVGVAGSCDVRHYEVEGDAPPAKEGTPAFRVRERVRAWMTPGRFTTLSRGRDNIHSFRAGRDGATVLDFTTQLSDKSVGYESFSALEVSSEPTDVPGVHEARWLGDPYK